METTSSTGPKLYRIKALHITERLKLEDLRDRFTRAPVEFSKYELVIKYSEESFTIVYNYGSIAFFNVPEDLQERELGNIQEYRVAQAASRTSDVYSVEVRETVQGGPSSQVFFDRVVTERLTYEKIKITCALLAESTALEYYEILIENLLERAGVFSRRLERQGKILESSEDLIKFIGMCLNTKQEILANLYIVDSPDETWDSVELDRIYRDLKKEMEIDVRYRALEHKIAIVQESVEVIVDLSKTKRETLLEMIIILLIAFSIVLELFKWK